LPGSKTTPPIFTPTAQTKGSQVHILWQCTITIRLWPFY